MFVPVLAMLDHRTHDKGKPDLKRVYMLILHLYMHE